jgi:hypothetical protein
MSTGSNKHRLWRQEINLFGHKMNMETESTHKRWVIKIFESYKVFKNLKPQFLMTKTPLILRLYILGEAATWVYCNFFKNKYEKIDRYISNYPIYKLIEKDKFSDYIINIGIYYFLGKLMYIRSKSTFYSIFFVGSTCSFALNSFNSYFKTKVSQETRIDEFNLFNPSSNILPKMIMSTSLLQYFYYFFSDSKFRLVKDFSIDKKAFVIFIWIYFTSKILQFFSNYTSESIK